jgi:uncharacterized protein (TIGR02117 family)
MGRSARTRDPGRDLLRVLVIALATTVAAILVLAAAYLLAALVLGLVPENANSTQPKDGISVYLISNGVHADLLIPVSALDPKWRARLVGSQSELAGVPYLAFGWGDREFYLNTPTWADLRASVALRALLGHDQTVVHVQPSGPPLASAKSRDELRRIRVTTAQMEQLLGYLERGFALDGAGEVEPIAGASYQGLDRFYPAVGHYSVFTTCNEWVRAGLAVAGVRVPRWAPFGRAIFYQLPNVD